MSHEQHNIVIGGKGIRIRSNGVNAEKTTFFYNFLRVFRGILSTIASSSLLFVSLTKFKGNIRIRDLNFIHIWTPPPPCALVYVFKIPPPPECTYFQVTTPPPPPDHLLLLSNLVIAQFAEYDTYPRALKIITSLHKAAFTRELWNGSIWNRSAKVRIDFPFKRCLGTVLYRTVPFSAFTHEQFQTTGTRKVL